VAQGLALLSKSYPALIVSGLAVFLALLRHLITLARYAGRGVGEGSAVEQRNFKFEKEPSPLPSPGVPGEGVRFGSRDVGLILLAAFVTVFPWIAICLIRWPELFMQENVHALRHLSQDIENWAQPWDRVLFDYWINIFYVYYPLVLVAAVIVAIRAFRLRDWRLWFLLAWAIGVLTPHLLATSKTMTATLIGWPAMWLMAGYLVSQAVRGCGMSAGAWAAAVVLPLVMLHSGDIPAGGWSLEVKPAAGQIMSQHLWVLWYVLGALLVGVVVAMLRRRWLRIGAVYVASAAMVVLAARWWGGDTPRGYAYLAWRATQPPKDEPDFSAIGAFAQKLPPQAVFMVQERQKLENKLIQFEADRSCYAVHPGDWPAMGQKLIDVGGLPYLITSEPIDLPAVFVDATSGRTVYACSPRAQSAAAERVHE
jgi:hypothetical protein